MKNKREFNNIVAKFLNKSTVKSQALRDAIFKTTGKKNEVNEVFEDKYGNDLMDFKRYISVSGGSKDSIRGMLKTNSSKIEGYNLQIKDLLYSIDQTVSINVINFLSNKVDEVNNGVIKLENQRFKVTALNENGFERRVYLYHSDLVKLIK